MKSGTTSLDSYLASHPSIFMNRMKEPTFFVHGDELKRVSPGLYEAGIWRDQDRYLRMFEDAGDAVVVGESSTNYSKLPQLTGVAQRIAEFNSAARILYIMRDPVERTISHYWHMVKYHKESRNMLTAVKQEPVYRQVSHYALQLAPFFECFGSDQIMVLTLENLRIDPVATMRDVYVWLGVDPEYKADNLNRPKNVTSAEIRQSRGGDVLRRLRHTRVWRVVAPLVPQKVQAIARRLSERRVDRSRVDTTDVAAYLRPLQQAQTRELTVLLGREFPEWRTTWPDE
jgi:hypothetical protein